MKNPVLAKRYAQGLVNALADEEEFRRVRGELLNLAGLIKSHRGLGRVLSSPFLKAEKKSSLVLEILDNMKSGEKTCRFIGLLADHGRLGLLDDILETISEAWNQKQGVLTFEVSSVIPLVDLQKERLKAELERLEKKPISLVYKIDPEIVGGLSLKRGHIVYDASIEGDLQKIKEKIQEG